MYFTALRFSSFVLFIGLFAHSVPAGAQVTRIDLEVVESPALGGDSFGAVAGGRQPDLRAGGVGVDGERLDGGVYERVRLDGRDGTAVPRQER